MQITSPHMTPDEFRQYGYAIIDWIADYWQNVERYPLLSPAQPGEIRAQLPATPPTHGEDFADIWQDFQRVILPGVTHWQNPNFYGFFQANTSAPSVLGELLSAGLGVQGMLWATSPACTELENVVLDWVVDLLGLPEKFKFSGTGGGVIHGSASEAILTAVIAARERATGWQSNEHGASGNLVMYVSSQTHSSAEKAAKIAGIGAANVRKIAVDELFAMRPDALQAQIAADRAAGLQPFLVIATIGTTSSNAIDDLTRIAPICQENGLWLHVDAAMSGTTALCPELRFAHAGMEWADSYCFDPHKWMFTNFDCDCFYVADRKALIQALSILPEYLRNASSESGAVVDYRDWQIPLGRRFRALKLWFVIRHYGADGLSGLVRAHVQMAQEFAEWVRASQQFELVAPVPFNLVCFRHQAGDAFNEKLMQTINRQGELYLTHTKLNGQFVLRLSVGQTYVTRMHVERAWQVLQETAHQLGG